MFDRTYWLFMVPWCFSVAVNEFPADLLGFWPGLAVIICMAVGAARLFQYILNRYWTRKP